jgi:hypothetical protein
MKTIAALLALALLACSSCTTLVGAYAPEQVQTPLAEAIPAGMGRVVFGRPGSYSMSAILIQATLGQTRVASIQNGSYAAVLAEPGEYQLRLEGFAFGAVAPMYGALLRATVRDGATVYVELNPMVMTMNFADMFAVLDAPRLNYAALARVQPLVAAVKADGTGRAAPAAAAAPAPAAPAAKAPAAAASAKAPPAAKAEAQVAVAEAGKNPVVPAAGKSSLSKNVIAVVIGNRDYKRGTGSVAYALNDAAAFRDLLVKSFGIDQKDIWYGENLGLADLMSIFGADDGYKKSRIYRTASMRDGPADLIVYYSGHGAPSTSGETKGKGYLVPVDADLLAIQNTGYPIDALLENIAAMKKDGVIGRSWISFDSCFSGQAGDGGLLVKNVSGLAVMPVAPKAKIEGAVVMFASSGEEFASWYPEEKHGLFTYFLLKGLSGAADANGDRSIGVGELDAYLRKWVPRFANGINAQEQTPQVLSSGEIAGFLTLKK